MKNKRAQQPPPAGPQLDEDDYQAMCWKIDDRLETEYTYSCLDKLSKEELIQLVIEVQEREESFANWLMSGAGGLIAFDGQLDSVKETFVRLKRSENLRVAEQKKGRQKQALEDAAKKEESKALGVDDFYGLLREAIELLKKNPELKENKSTEIGAIREIIVGLLCEPNRSRHSNNRTVWVGIVKKNVDPSHIDTAKKQLERIKPTSF
jgi:hypothetical protein